MNKDQPLLNPSPKNDSINSNSESTSDQYSQYSKTQEIVDADIENYDPEKSSEFNQPNFEAEVKQSRQEKETDFIPVAYRVLGDKKSFLDLILTPWGVFSIILFFLANAILFLNFSRQSSEVITLDSSETSSETIVDENQTQLNQETEIKIDSVFQEEDKNKQNSPKNEPFGAQNSLSSLKDIPTPISLSPPPANPLNSLKPNLNPTIIVNKQSSPYPDLLAALQSNASNTTPSNNLPSPAKSPPVSAQTNPNSSPLSNSQSAINNLQYYVITEYNGIEFFEQIQNSFPDALITNIETEIKIQLGVFDNEIDAKNLIQQLKQKQISAYLYTSQSKQK